MAETVKRLQEEIPGIRIGVIAHGDYCDSASTYVTKIKDLTTNSQQLCTFVENVEATGNVHLHERKCIYINHMVKTEVYVRFFWFLQAKYPALSASAASYS